MDYQDLLALDDYCRILLFPLLDTCSHPQDATVHYDYFGAKLALLEAVLWLDAGVRLGMFANEASIMILRQIKPIVRRQLDEVTFQHKTAIPEVQYSRLLDLVSKETFATALIFSDPAALFSRLKTVLGLTARFNSERSAMSTIAAIAILSEIKWERLLAISLNSQDLKEALDGKIDPWISGYASIAKAGVFGLIEYTDAVLDMLAFDQCPRGVSSEDWIQLRRLVADATSIRLNFASNRFTERVLQMFKALGVVTQAELTAYGINSNPLGWSQFASALIEGWRDLSEPSANTTGA